MPWADRTEARWNKRLKKTRLVHEDQSLQQAMAEIPEAAEQDTVFTVCNPPYWSTCWTLYKRNVPVEILPCWNVKYELSFSDGIVNRSDCILVSAALHAIDPDYQPKLRIMGKDSTLGRARTSLWWPGMNKQLKQFIDICEVYNAFQTKNQQFKSWVSYFLVEHYLVLVDA